MLVTPEEVPYDSESVSKLSITIHTFYTDVSRL